MFFCARTRFIYPRSEHRYPFDPQARNEPQICAIKNETLCATHRFQEDLVERTRTTKGLIALGHRIPRWNRAQCLLALFVTFLSLYTPASFGQASSSSDAAGRITDPTGATVPGAVIRLINNGTRAERSTTTNDAGDWSIPNLPPASYTLRVEKAGFK